MSRNKKVLVRNSSAPVRCAVDKVGNTKKVHFSEEVAKISPTLSAPEFCTLLQLADEIKTIKSCREPLRSFSEGSKCKNLNFPPEEKIYRDLIDLEIPVVESENDVKSQPCVKLKKDPELDINKYTKYELAPEYFFTSYFAPVVKKQKTTFDGHSIYQNLVMWSESTD